MFLQAGDQLAPASGCGCIPGQHHKVDWGQSGSAQPETLPDQASKPVAPDGQANFLFRNRETQARPTQRILMEEYGEKTIRGPLTVLEHVVEARRMQQAQLPREVLLVFARRMGGKRGDRDLPGDRRRQTVSRARPFARRRFSTRRPARVAMRARNPWVRTRFSLLGW